MLEKLDTRDSLEADMAKLESELQIAASEAKELKAWAAQLRVVIPDQISKKELKSED